MTVHLGGAGPLGRMRRVPARTWGYVAAAVAAVAALVAAWRGTVVAARWARAGFRTARYAVRLATLTAYRRCPDCRRVLRREARVCRSCGFRAR